MGEWLLSRRDRLIVARHEYVFRRLRHTHTGTKCLGSDAEKPRPEGRSKSWSVPQIFVGETEPRHEQATARRMLMPLQKRQVFLWKSSGPMMFDLILDGMNGFRQLRDAHAESAITLLPAKVVQLSKSLVNPGR
jgi:hypothetical protein